MARLEMDCILKRLGFFSKIIALCLGKLNKTHIMVDSLFKNSLDISLSVL